MVVISCVVTPCVRVWTKVTDVSEVRVASIFVITVRNTDTGDKMTCAFETSPTLPTFTRCNDPGTKLTSTVDRGEIQNRPSP
jgi:hypothetical protein